MDLIIHRRASKNAREIGEKYRAISQTLYDRFWDELEEAIDLIEKNPERHHFDPSGMRRSNLRKFPYHVVFEERLSFNRISLCHEGIIGCRESQSRARCCTQRLSAP